MRILQRRILRSLPYDGWSLTRESCSDARRIRQLITAYRWRRFSQLSRFFLVPAARLLWLLYCPFVAFRLALGAGASGVVSRSWRATLCGWRHGNHPKWTLGRVAQWSRAPGIDIGNLDDGHWLRFWILASQQEDRILALDKRVFADRLRLLGVAAPQTLLEIAQGTKVDFGRFPWGEAETLFVKPRHGSRAVGVSSIRRLDGPYFLVNGSEKVDSAALIAVLAESLRSDSLLVQLYFPAATQTVCWSLNAPIELRITTARAPGKDPIVVGCNMKIQPPGAHVTTAMSGALIVPVDPVSGEMEAGFFLAQPGKRHNDAPWNGNKLKGCLVPNYFAAVKEVLLASQMLPSLVVIGWDVLLTDSGPVVLEANSNPSFRMIHFWHAATNTPSALLPVLRQCLADGHFGHGDAY